MNDPLLGQVVGPCRVEALIGEGAFGRVYRCHHLRLGSTVALKILICKSAPFATLARFQREARSLALLQDENVAKVFDLDAHEGRPFIVQEYVEGQSLAQWVESNGALEVGGVVSLGTDLAKGLLAIHGAGLVHRDLKPENIVLTPQGKPKIVDFGLVSVKDDDGFLTRQGAMVGSPHYLAPEQIQTKAGRIGPAADLYSLGGVLYHALTGRIPLCHEGDEDNLVGIMARRLSEEPADVRTLRPQVPAWLAELIRSLMQIDPASRPSTQEVVTSLQTSSSKPRRTTKRLAAVRQPSSRRVGPKSSKGPVVRPKSSSTPLLVAAVLGGVLLLGLGVVATSGRGAPEVSDVDEADDPPPPVDEDPEPTPDVVSSPADPVDSHPIQPAIDDPPADDGDDPPSAAEPAEPSDGADDDRADPAPDEDGAFVADPADGSAEEPVDSPPVEPPEEPAADPPPAASPPPNAPEDLAPPVAKVAPLQPPAPPDAPPPGIDEVVERARALVERHQVENGAFKGNWTKHRTAETSMSLMALLRSGTPPSDPKVELGFNKLIGSLKFQTTFEVSVAILALEARYTPGKGSAKARAAGVRGHFRRARQRDRSWLSRAVSFLVVHQLESGGWSASPSNKVPDFANTLFAILALKAAQRMGTRKIPKTLWLKTAEYALAAQEAGGPQIPRQAVPMADEPVPKRGHSPPLPPMSRARGWSNLMPGPKVSGSNARISGSMTSAGLVALAICKSELEREKGYKRTIAPRVDAAMRDGVAWLTQQFEVTKNPGRDKFVLVYLFALQHAATHLGLHRFGDRDWFREGAEHILAKAQSDGSFKIGGGDEGGRLVGASFAILFLKRSALAARIR